MSSLENSPESSKDIIDIAAKFEYLKLKTEYGDVKLNSHDEIEIQPKKNILGVKLKKTTSITPTITVDTKKLRKQKDINPEVILDNAIEEYLNEN